MVNTVSWLCIAVEMLPTSSGWMECNSCEAGFTELILVIMYDKSVSMLQVDFWNTESE